MPLDSTGFYRTAEPSLADLARLLRHPDEWPTGFRWNYCDERRCAVGLARAMWPGIPVTAGDQLPLWHRGKVHLPNHLYNHVRPRGWRRFLGRSGRPFVKPEDVASAIDRYLAK